MNIVKLNDKPTLEDALAVVDGLRQDLIDGKVIGFFCAGLDREDATIIYVSTVSPVSRLRMQGAMGQALHNMQVGVV